jgi:hypothetical protein
MKIVVLAALVGSAAAFAPAFPPTSTLSRPLAAVEAAAKSAEEDLELTLKVIMSSMTDDGAGIDDSDIGDDDVAPPAAEVAAVASPSSSGVNLWSVGYDDTVKLAYEAAGSKGDFAAFRSKYLEDWSAVVAKKGLL